VLVELDTGDGTPTTRKTLPLDLAILCDDAPAPATLFFGRMQPGEVRQVAVNWPTEMSAPYAMTRTDLSDAAWEATAQGGIVRLTMPEVAAGGVIRGSVEVTDSTGQRWALPVLALHADESESTPIIEHVARLVESGASREALAVVLHRSPGDAWLPIDDPFLKNEADTVALLKDRNDPDGHRLIHSSKQVGTFFRLMTRENPIPDTHVAAVRDLIASLPAPCDRSRFVQQVVTAMEQKLAAE